MEKKAWKSKKQILHLAISAFLTLLLLVIVFAESSLGELRENLRRIDLNYCFAFICCSLAALLFRTFRYWTMLRYMQGAETPSYWKIFLVTGVRNAFVDFLPARLGEISYVYFLNRFGIRIVTGISSFGLCIALDLLGLLLVAFIFAIFSAVSGANVEAFMNFGAEKVILGLILLIGGFALGVFVLEHVDGGFKWASRVLLKFPRCQKLGDLLLVIAGDINCVKGFHALSLLLMLTVLLRVAKYGGLYLLTLSVLGAWNMDARVLNPLAAFAVFVISEASASLPISGLMGFGIYEGVWSMLFSIACGVVCSALPTTTIAFLVHVLTQILGYGIGLLCLLIIFLYLALSAKWKERKGLAVLFLILSLVPESYAQAEKGLYFEVNNPLKLKGRIAFSAEFNESSNIYVLDFEKEKVIKIGPEETEVSYPSFSPDGRLLAMSIGKKGERNIAVMDAKGGVLKILGQSKFNSDNPAFSPDGSSVVFYRENKNNVNQSNLFLGFPEKPDELQQLSNFKGRNTTPQWSSNGGLIAFSTDRFWPGWDICILDIKSGKEECPLKGIQTYCRPRYSHNGKTLAYSHGAFEDVDIFTRDLESNKDRQVTSLAGRDYDATWSPDDEYIAFTNNGEKKEKFELFVVALADKKIKQLIKSNASIRYLSWVR